MVNQKPQTGQETGDPHQGHSAGQNDGAETLPCQDSAPTIRRILASQKEKVAEPVHLINQLLLLGFCQGPRRLDLFLDQRVNFIFALLQFFLVRVQRPESLGGILGIEVKAERRQGATGGSVTFLDLHLFDGILLVFGHEAHVSTRKRLCDFLSDHRLRHNDQL